MTEIEKLVEKCGLGDIIGEAVPVSGGFMHKMYKVKTSLGTYAVKCLNPEIMKRPGAMENFARAESLESVLENEGLPVVAAIYFDEKKMVELDGRYFYVFKWQEGKITDWNLISEYKCYMAGEILGKIHKIDSKKAEFQEISLNETDFEKYLKDSEGTEIYSLLSDNLTLIKNAQKKLNDARKMLPPISAIINDDMDPKNVMWHNDSPYIIDLECLEYGNPVYSCLNLSLQWSGTVTGKFKKKKLKSFFEGYLTAYNNGFKEYDKLFGIAYSWVEWLEYNIRRALGMEGDDPESIRLGVEEVKKTIGRIKYLDSVEKNICRTLKSIFRKKLFKRG